MADKPLGPTEPVWEWRLRKDAADARAGDHNYVTVRTTFLEAALAEIDRLRAGDFTEPEFQALCHKFTADDRCRFEQGCKEYQDKLFGPKG